LREQGGVHVPIHVSVVRFLSTLALAAEMPVDQLELRLFTTLHEFEKARRAFDPIERAWSNVGMDAEHRVCGGTVVRPPPSHTFCDLGLADPAFAFCVRKKRSIASPTPLEALEALQPAVDRWSTALPTRAAETPVRIQLKQLDGKRVPLVVVGNMLAKELAALIAYNSDLCPEQLRLVVHSRPLVDEYSLTRQGGESRRYRSRHPPDARIFKNFSSPVYTHTHTHVRLRSFRPLPRTGKCSKSVLSPACSRTFVATVRTLTFCANASRLGIARAPAEPNNKRRNADRDFRAASRV
jgi:hypothetical protein